MPNTDFQQLKLRAKINPRPALGHYFNFWDTSAFWDN